MCIRTYSHLTVDTISCVYYNCSSHWAVSHFCKRSIFVHVYVCVCGRVLGGASLFCRGLEVSVWRGHFSGIFPRGPCEAWLNIERVQPTLVRGLYRRAACACVFCFLYNVHMSIWLRLQTICVCMRVCVWERARERKRERLCILSFSPLAFLSFDGQYGNEMPLSCGQTLCCVCVSACVWVCVRRSFHMNRWDREGYISPFSGKVLSALYY